MIYTKHLSGAGALFLASILASGPVGAITPADLASRLARNEPMLLVDVRPTVAYTAGHIPGAINIPLGLLPHKPLPASQQVLVYGDGLGVIDDAQALAVLRSKPGLNADVVVGGYAAWLAETRISTALPGIGPERLPGITYDQLVAAGKGDMVLVDLRTPVGRALATGGSNNERQGVAEAAPDLLAQFAATLGVPVVAASGLVAVVRTQSTPANAAAGPARAAAPAPASVSTNQLMVLIADSDAAATDAARQLRSNGIYRFTILIGGTETIRHEGRTGTGRMDGAGATQNR